MTDPPALLRYVMGRVFDRLLDPARQAKTRARAEARRVREGRAHVVEYFHQHDDPYSMLAIQVIDTLCARYDIELVHHDIRATGGRNQPELAKLDVWARRYAQMIAPHYWLVPPSELDPAQNRVAGADALDRGSARLAQLGHYSGAMFYYEGEWYWGVDRLFYLEQRLRDLGVCREPALP